MRARSHIIRNLFFKAFLYSYILLHLGCIKHLVSFNSNKEHKTIEKSYYNNGNIEYIAEWYNDKLDGVSRYFSIDGHLISESQYSSGKLHGITKKYFPNNIIMYEVNFFFGKKHGLEKWYYDNGQIKSEQSFNYGNSNKEIKRWTPDGSVLY